MHTLSARAFRLATLSVQKPNLATRPIRFFHASAAVRAAEDGNNGPRDDGSKPEKENGAGEGENGDENLFGENATVANGEGQGRKRAGNGSLRSRTLRNRKPEELPPVHVPKSFLSGAVSRLEDAKALIHSDLKHEREARILLEKKLYSPPPSKMWGEYNDSLLEATAWTEETLDEAIKTLESNTDSELIHKKGDVLVASAFWAAAQSAREAHGEDAVAKMLERGSISSSRDLMSFFIYSMSRHANVRPTPDQAKSLMDMAMSERPLEGSAVEMYKEEWIQEVIASVNTDLLVQAPKNVKLADLRRPVTIIDIPNYSGYTIPRDIVQHVATRLEADVLHLRASDIAHIVGSYLGQDAVRAPGAISQLGYKAAENAGRLRVNSDLNEDDMTETIRMPYTIVMRDERLKKDNKRYLSLMDDFLNGSNRGKSDELWEDLKINAALEELVHCADSDPDSAEQRPLIVHIDDFNALNMDLECGAMIIGKIRKLVDGLWADGRRIALVGSCSTKNAPKPYMNALRELQSTERVIHLYSDSFSQGPKMIAYGIKSGIWEIQDYVRENEGNIVKTLLSMIEPASETSTVSTGEIGLSEIDLKKLPKSWKEGVLPLNEVYRIATAMIGYSKNPADIFSLESVEKAAGVIQKLDQLKQASSKVSMGKEGKGQRNESRNQFDPRKLNPPEEDHEEKMESGLVNAEDIRTTFKDIHAPKETIESVKMLTTLSLIRPEAFSYGVLATDRIPGCLLYGPPGTGKTLLAKAVAKESGANMIEISGASINNKYVGESEKNVRALFRLARRKEPLVIFIDEADALLGARGRRDQGSRRETINQFLREWDGLDKMKAFVMVATNRPFDLDEAVLRRLPRKLLIDLPLEADRAAILRIHLKDEILDEATVSMEDIAKRTPLYSGSDLKNVCVAAAMAAVKEELELEQQQQQQQQEQEIKGEGENKEKKKEKTTMKRRVLAGRHFDKALLEIGASVSEDMATLTAIRKFDEKYGDGGAGRRRRRKGMGFGVAADVPDAQEARVRSGSGR
ncbi:AAA-domain-containing protein [Hypoxylon rubiginosum]|uniref:AAA-domain-containing protein n=1 Tax=Hypoxylon rubiginosum TaxID=110542 RepID=A0ACB9Z6G4_9PEZI|nr:AAA-domain-containing protein [Hypoxylon rubiginosum]